MQIGLVVLLTKDAQQDIVYSLEEYCLQEEKQKQNVVAQFSAEAELSLGNPSYYFSSYFSQKDKH